jgi:hypothetical protein
MTLAIARSIAAAALAGVVLVAASWIDFAFCSKHQAWIRHEHGDTRPIAGEGYQVARPGDATFVCATEHRFEGWLDRHEDLSCYCASATLSAADVGRLLAGTCIVDAPHPSRTDERGACPRARCDNHVR